MSTKKVLMVLYEFPPIGSRSTKRSMKFIKYMTSFGYLPVVLTVDHPNYPFFDSTLSSELPNDLSIYRAVSLENIFKSSTDLEGDNVEDNSQKDPKTDMSLLKRLLKGLYHSVGNAIKILDSRILWMPFALKKGLEIIKKEKIDVIYSSGPSHTNHLVALILKKIRGIPLVVDFRDAWVSDPAKRKVYRWQEAVQRCFEKKVILNADKVISTTDGITSDFITRYGNIPGRFVTITNGYDVDDVKDIKKVKVKCNRSPFTMVHVGTLERERSPKKFLEAVGKLAKENRDIIDNIRIIFVGHNRPFQDGKTIEDYIKEENLDNVVKITGFVSRKKSIEYMMDANLLLLIIGDVPIDGRHKYGISGKIYDYALSGNPIMTISSVGSSADMARYLGIDCIIDPLDVDRIKESIKTYYTLFMDDKYDNLSQINQSRLEEFDFKNLTRKFTENMDLII